MIAGVVAHLLRQRPAVGQLGALGGRLVVLHQRDAGVAQRVDPGRDRELGVAAERRSRSACRPRTPRRGRAPRRAPASLITSAAPSIVSKRGRAVVALDQPRDVLVEDLVAQVRGDHVDELLAVQDAREVAVVEDALGAGQCRAPAPVITTGSISAGGPPPPSPAPSPPRAAGAARNSANMRPSSQVGVVAGGPGRRSACGARRRAAVRGRLAPAGRRVPAGGARCRPRAPTRRARRAPG